MSFSKGRLGELKKIIDCNVSQLLDEQPADSGQNRHVTDTGHNKITDSGQNRHVTDTGHNKITDSGHNKITDSGHKKISDTGQRQLCVQQELTENKKIRKIEKNVELDNSRY